MNTAWKLRFRKLAAAAVLAVLGPLPHAAAATAPPDEGRPLGVLLAPVDGPTARPDPQPSIAPPATARPLGVLIDKDKAAKPGSATAPLPDSAIGIGAGFGAPSAPAPSAPPPASGSVTRPLGVLIDKEKAGTASPTAVPDESLRPGSGFVPPSAPRPNAPAAAGSGDRPLGVLIDTKPDPAPAPRAPRPIASPAMGVPTAPPPTPTAGARSERPLGSLIKPIFAAPAHPSGLAPAASPADPATAPAPGPTTAPSAGAPADQPVHLVADQLQFDRERKIITADGNVEVRYGARQLSADHITYNQNNNVVTAKGNVTLIEPSGEKIFGDTMDVSGDLKDALIHNIGIILQDRSRIAGVNAEHTAGRITNLRKAVYSPCNLCADDPTGPPMWRIKAVKVIHDKDAKVVEYRDAWLEVFGVPVAYTPYFRHPDPTVKGKSGFLFPKFGNSSDFGAVIETPYFWNISPHEDATITPIWMTKEFPVLRAEYRKRMLKGALDFDGSVTDNTADDEFDTEKGELGVRGHILGKGRFDVDQTWRWGFDLERATDDTYMRRYGFSSPASLNSQLFAEGFRRQNYFSVKALAFQGLAANDDQDEIPIALPLIDFNHFGRRDRLGGRTNLDLNLLALTRSEGTDVRRLSVHPSWERPFSTGLGDQYRLTVGLNADLYHVSNLERSGIDGRFTGLSQRAVPYAALDWRMPFIKLDNKISQTIEPVASVVWRPYGGNPDDIPNEDSTDLEFDETNLFDVNRFTGIDRVEGGPRINYGINWGVFGKEGGSTKFFLGQSYRLKADGTFTEGSGLEDNLSDLVSRVEISPGPHFDLLYRSRFTSTSFSPRRNQVQLSAGVPAFQVSGNYVFVGQQEASEFDGREELSLNATTEIDRFWRGGVRAVRDMDAEEMRSIGVDLVYENECIIFRSQLTRTFFEGRDLKPTDAITFHVTLKTIGEVQTGISRSGSNI